MSTDKQFSSIALDGDGNMTAVSVTRVNIDLGISVYKMDTLGAILKKTRIVVADVESFDATAHIAYGNNGFYYIACSVEKGLYLLKLNDELEVVASQLSQDSIHDSVHHMLLGTDNALYLAGIHAVTTSKDSPSILKFDADLNFVNRKNLSNFPEGRVAGACWAADDTPVFLLDLEVKSSENYAVVLKTDKDLNILVSNKIKKTVGKAVQVEYQGIVQDAQGDYLIGANLHKSSLLSFMRLDSTLKFTGLAEIAFTTDADRLSLLRLANGDLVFNHEKGLFRLNKDGIYQAHLNGKSVESYQILEDSNGRLIIAGKGGAPIQPMVLALPNDLYITAETLTDSDFISQEIIKSSIGNEQFSNEAIEVSLASNQLISLSVPEPVITEPAGNHEVHTIDP